MNTLILEPVDISRKETLRNLFNLYQHDFAAFRRDLYPHVDEQGFYDHATVDVFFEEGKREHVTPLLIRLDEKIAGFIILSTPPFTKKGCDFCIQEMLVLNPYRGQGVAQDACSLLFKEHPGRYCLTVLPENIRAEKFWKKLLARYSPEVSLANDMTLFEFCTID